MNEDSKTIIPENKRKGRGSRSNISGRYETISREYFDDGWENQNYTAGYKTETTLENAKSILTKNQSPDIPFEQSINPYRGCEHGCPYCFARPTHAYMGLSPGLDFESKLFVKKNAAELFKKEIAKPGYSAKPIALGTNTDPYQPIEKQYAITRSILEICVETKHPATIVTKSSLITRDIDLISELAQNDLIHVGMSLTTLDRYVARSMEPRATTPAKRLETIHKLTSARVPVILMLAPVVPGINDHELENILAEAKNAGACHAIYVLLRLPLELKDIMREWLETDFPYRAKKVFNIMKTMRGGKLYDSQWGERMVGRGPYAEMIAQRFALARKKYNLHKQLPPLRIDLFTPPKLDNSQLELF